MKYWVSALTFAVVLLGIGYLNLYCNKMSFDSNNAGVIISALGVLVTALIGWQVFNAIEHSKMTRRMDRLKSELDRKSDLWTQRNLAIQHLVDAHGHFQSALNSEYHSDTYLEFANALILFLRSNVPIDYRPLQQTLQGLTDSLIRIENESAEDDIQNFLDSMDDFNDLYQDIIAAIHMRKQDIERLHEELLEIRSNRLALRDRLLSRRHP